MTPDDSVSARLSLSKGIIGAGALAAALASVIALGTTVLGWFGGGSDAPQGRVDGLAVRIDVVPLTYREWRGRERVPTRGVAASQLQTQGLLVKYDMMASGYSESDELPVRISVYDHITGLNRSYEVDAVRVRSGDRCGCSDWVPVADTQHLNTVTVSVYPPGPIRGEPLRQETAQSTLAARRARAS